MLPFGRSMPRKPHPVGGVKGHNINNKSLPGSPVCARGASHTKRKDHPILFEEDTHCSSGLLEQWIETDFQIVSIVIR